MSSSVKSCSLNPWPTFLIHKYVDILTPCVTHLVNTSLKSGRLPDNQKHAIVSPLLKKLGLDMSDMANFQSVSNVNISVFLSKVVKKVVARWMNDYLAEHHLLPRLQSAYKWQHSIETALLHVMSDALTAADDRQATLIGLLDMSATFDCVDPSILLQRLERNFGITALQWVTSYITGRTHRYTTVSYLSCSDCHAASRKLQCLARCSSISTQQTSVKLSSFKGIKCISMLTTAKSTAAFLSLRLRLLSMPSHAASPVCRHGWALADSALIKQRQLSCGSVQNRMLWGSLSTAFRSCQQLSQ